MHRQNPMPVIPTVPKSVHTSTIRDNRKTGNACGEHQPQTWNDTERILLALETLSNRIGAMEHGQNNQPYALPLEPMSYTGQVQQRWPPLLPPPSTTTVHLGHQSSWIFNYLPNIGSNSTNNNRNNMQPKWYPTTQTSHLWRGPYTRMFKCVATWETGHNFHTQYVRNLDNIAG